MHRSGQIGPAIQEELCAKAFAYALRPAERLDLRPRREFPFPELHPLSPALERREEGGFEPAFHGGGFGHDYQLR